MHLCFMASSFPRGKEAVYTFVKGYVDAIADRGIKCTVISPQSVTKVLMGRAKMRPTHWHYMTNNGNRVDVYQPRYITLSTHMEKKRISNLKKVVEKAYRSLDTPVDAVYAHFWVMGIVAAQVAGGKPVFVTCGEGGKIRVERSFDKQELAEALKKISGVVHVSSKTLDETKATGLQEGIPYIIAPNGYNPASFCSKDKTEVRARLGYPKDGFIVAFVGSFDGRKGTHRLSDALKLLNEGKAEKDRIYSIFIGKGKDVPDCSNILYCGPAAHDEIVDYLNAADVFVLPTNNEGCCNAIVEALACGLPVVSSNKKFNDDILDENCSLRIDEMSVQEIADAIDRLHQDRALLDSLAAGAKAKAKTLTIQERVKNIIAFIEERIAARA